MSDPDRWHWHAYDYAFRHIALGEKEIKSPIDPEGKWFASDLMEAAAVFYRALFPAAASYPIPRPSFGGTVRQDWRKFKAEHLNDAERALAEQSIERLAREARDAAAKLAAKLSMRGRQRSDGKSYAPRPIATHPLISEDDPRVIEKLRQIEEN